MFRPIDGRDYTFIGILAAVVLVAVANRIDIERVRTEMEHRANDRWRRSEMDCWINEVQMRVDKWRPPEDRLELPSTAFGAPSK
jgi:hypothetical protein